MLTQQIFEMLLSCIIFNCGPNQWAPLGETSLSFCPWKSMKNLGKKNSFLMAQSVSDSPHRVFVHKRVCIDLESSLKVKALALCEVLVWTILSFFGPVWLILYLHRGLGQRVHVNGFRFNIRVFEYLCIKSLQVWYFLFHRPDLAHSKDYCMKCSWTKFQGQRLRSKQSPSKWLSFYCSLLIRNTLKWSRSQWCY